MEQIGLDWCGGVWRGVAWRGIVWFDRKRFGIDWSVLDWCGSDLSDVGLNRLDSIGLDWI